MLVRRVLILAFILLAGCQPATRPERSAPQDSPYYPLQVGTTWVFRGPDHQRVMRVARHEVVDGTPCAFVETLRDDKVIEDNDVCVKADGIYLLTADGEKLSAPLPILKLPPRRGTTWRVNFNKGGKRSQGVYVLGNEEVEVPAGKFHTVTLKGEILEGTTRTLAFTYWFAPGVGMVKQLLKTGNRQTEYDLEKFEPGNAK
jgi:hypothetical protein